MTIESTITPFIGGQRPVLPHGRYLHEAKLFQYREGLVGTLLASRPFFMLVGAKAVFDRGEIPFEHGAPPGGMQVYVEVTLDDGTRFWRSDVFGFIGGHGTLVVDMSGVRQAASDQPAERGWLLAKIILLADEGSALRNEGACFDPPPHTDGSPPLAWGTVYGPELPAFLETASAYIGSRGQLREKDGLVMVDRDDDEVVQREIAKGAYAYFASRRRIASPWKGAEAGAVERALHRVQALKLQPGDVLVGILGDPNSGWLPGPDYEVRQQALLSAALEELGLKDSVAVLTIPYATKLGLLRAARPAAPFRALVEALKDTIRAGDFMGAHMATVDKMLEDFLAEAARPVLPSRLEVPAVPPSFVRALEAYVAAVDKAIVATAGALLEDDIRRTVPGSPPGPRAAAVEELRATGHALLTAAHSTASTERSEGAKP